MGRGLRGLVVGLPIALIGLGGPSCYGHQHRRGAQDDAKRTVGELVRIPDGYFVRGDLNGEPSEYPERRVLVSGFAIERYEVSNRAYSACVAAGACDLSPYLDDPELGRPQHPVVGLSWDDARRYCEWAGRRLPTEAEWEYAARGTDNRQFPWSGAFDPRKANTRRSDDGFASTAPVVALAAGDSPFGVRNMAGNAAEWVNDYFDPLYYRTSGDVPNPRGPRVGRERVVRGGSYRDGAHSVRVAARRAQSPTDIDNTIGVRCAR